MEKQFVAGWEFEPLVTKAIGFYLKRYGLKIEEPKENGIVLRNDRVHISITDKYGEFSVGISNGNDYVTINELIFKKYPNYIELIRLDKEKIVFKLQIDDFGSYKEYFIYSVKTSFDFIDQNFPGIFDGDFSSLR